MPAQTISFYNKIARLYPLVDLFLKPQKKILCNGINSLSEGRLLEIGVGNGSHLHLYKKHQITGIDTSTGMLEIARKRAGSDMELLEMDGTTLTFGNDQFDYVVLSHVIAVVNDPEQMMLEVFRVLKPQGKVFVLNHFTPDNWLRYMDSTFAIVSKLLHFKSVFRIEQISVLKKLHLINCTNLGFASYFKLLIYQKP